MMMNESAIMMETLKPARSFGIHKFAKGALSGAFSGTVMMGAVALLTAITGGSFLAVLGAAPLMIAATTLSGGVLTSARTLFEGKETKPQAVSAPANAIPSPEASIGQEVAMNDNEVAPTKNWTATTGRDEGKASRIQQILDQGASDKERAAAMLAARTNAVNENEISR